jgi:Fe-S-cluster containining protein
MAKKVLCDKCTALCCRYFALPIETPTTKEDYDDIRWYLCHKGITVFVEDGDWYINIKNTCKYLADDYTCRIYKKRPRICRQYSHKDCDFTEGEYDYKLHFTNDKQISGHIRTKFDNNPSKKRKKKTRKKKRK